MSILLEIMFWCLHLLVGVCAFHRSLTVHQCPPGYYVLTPRIGPDICRWCIDGINFIPRYPEFWHSIRTCFNCTRVQEENLEVLVSPCNKTHDAEILCRDGYYRRRARNVREIDTCVKCSVCENVARPCQGYYDTVCCLPSYDAVLTNNGIFVCQERPIVCGRGEFLSEKTEQCTPCAPDTFMMLDKHNQTNCQACQTLDDVSLNHEIFQPCNQTHPTLLGCRDGYYRLVSESTEEKVSLCQPCTKCGDQQHEVRKCDRFQDTVCCDSVEMIVEDTDLGPTCRLNNISDGSINISTDLENPTETESIPVCGAGENVRINLKTNQKTCLPCPSSLCGYTTRTVNDTLSDITGHTDNPGHKHLLSLSIALYCLVGLALVVSLVFIWLRRRRISQIIKDQRNRSLQKNKEQTRSLLEVPTSFPSYKDESRFICVYTVSSISAASSTQLTQREIDYKIKKRLHLLLTGKTAHEKSSTGNLLLGSRLFESKSSATAVTSDVTSHYTKYKNFIVKVVDTPGLMDTCLTREEEQRQAFRNMNTAVSMCSEGVDAFLYVHRFGIRFTDEEIATLSSLKNILGESYMSHLIVILSRGDNFQNEIDLESEGRRLTFEEWCEEQTGEFQELFQNSGGRFVLINNLERDEKRKQEKRDQVYKYVIDINARAGRYNSESFKMAAIEREKKSKDNPILMEKIQESLGLLTYEIENLSTGSSLQKVEKIIAYINNVERASETYTSQDIFEIRAHLNMLKQKVFRNDLSDLKPLNKKIERFRTDSSIWEFVSTVINF